MKRPALVVMAKEPLPGRTKTRLEPELTPEQCASLSLAFLKDAIELAVSIPVFTPFIAFTPRNAFELFKTITPTGMGMLAQAGGNLGKRMLQLIETLEAGGFSPVVLIGTDIPAMQPGTLLRALEELKHHDFCFGPSTDGGYYLVGANRPDIRMFQNIEWSTSNVLRQTEQAAFQAGFTVALLEEYSDIDTPNHFKKLLADLDRLHSTSGVRIPKYTERWMIQNRNLVKQVCR